MKVVLLSGGSGKRLWPLSSESRPKQFLKLLRGPNKQAESMVQRVWRQLAEHGMDRDAYVSTSRSQVDLLRCQLGHQVPLIVEPQQRDTFPAIALATSYLLSVIGLDEREVIAVMPVDPYVETHFFRRVKMLEHVIETANVDIALLGVKPVYASTKYGYIIPVDSNEPHATAAPQYRHVMRFIEKPSEETARQLLGQQALWNCGVFAFTLGFMREQLHKRGLPARYEEMLGEYERLPKISFDYEIVEKTKKAAVLSYDGDWMDIGTWNTLTQVMQQRMLGAGFLGPDCDNTSVINELDIPVVTIGVSNVVVAVCADGILIADKAKSHFVKEIDWAALHKARTPGEDADE